MFDHRQAVIHIGTNGYGGDDGNIKGTRSGAKITPRPKSPVRPLVRLTDKRRSATHGTSTIFFSLAHAKHAQRACTKLGRDYYVGIVTSSQFGGSSDGT